MWKYLIAKLKCKRGEVNATATESTKESGAEEKSSQSGEKLEGLVGDIDFTDVPEAERANVIKLVTEKVKNYDAGFRTKSEALAEKTKELEVKAEGLRDLEKLQDEIKGNPEMEKVVTKTINDFRAGKTTTPKQVDTKLKKLDQLIESAETPDQREQLKTMREIIQQETESGTAEEIKTLKEKVEQLTQSAAAGLQGGIDNSMQTLRDRFGDELVDKYDVSAREMLAKYPVYLKTPSKVLFNLAKDEEIFEAHEKIRSKQAEVENKRKAAGTFPGGDSKPTDIELPRDKAGRVIGSKLIERMEAAGRFK